MLRADLRHPLDRSGQTAIRTEKNFLRAFFARYGSAAPKNLILFSTIKYTVRKRSMFRPLASKHCPGMLVYTLGELCSL